jgi:hypothetical protein
MSGLSFTGVMTHDNNVRVAEGVAQAAKAAANTQAAVTAAEITYYRTRKASALANGLASEAATAQLALMTLGTGGT